MAGAFIARARYTGPAATVPMSRRMFSAWAPEVREERIRSSSRLTRSQSMSRKLSGSSPSATASASSASSDALVIGRPPRPAIAV